MTNAGWVVRFYLPFDDSYSTFVGNYEHLGSRHLDDIVIFSGFYGLDYMKWYVHDDLNAYNYKNFSFEMKIYADGNLTKDSTTYQNNFRIVDVSYDEKSNRYIVLSISDDQATLSSNTIALKKSSLEYNKNRTPEMLLKEVLHDTGVYTLIFHEHEEESKKSFQFEYPKFTFDPLDTIYDFISYVTEENKFEWAINKGFLFVGPELKAYEEYNAEKPFIGTDDHISVGQFTYKYSFPMSQLDVLYHYDMDVGKDVIQLRCIWAKHQVGSRGDMTKGCFVPIGTRLSKEQYALTLEGETEKAIFNKILFKEKHYNQMRIGRVTTDSGDSSYVDEVSIEKDKNNYSKKTPKDQVINRTDPIFTIPRVGRTAEYLDNGAGQLFPRVNDVTKAPNSVIYAINDRIEQTVKGPFVMGNGDPSFVTINKGVDDYRFTLPNGWTMFVKGDGTFIMDFDGVDANTIPTEDTGKSQITFNPTTNTISINTPGTVKIAGGTLGLAKEDHVHVITMTPPAPQTAACGASTSNTSKTKAD